MLRSKIQWRRPFELPAHRSRNCVENGGAVQNANQALVGATLRNPFLEDLEAYLLAIVSPSGFRIATVRMESSYQLSSKNAPGILRATVHVVYSAVRIHLYMIQ